MSDYEIVSAKTTDLAEIRKLLKSAHLPESDVTCEGIQHFLLIRKDGVLQGVVGLEVYGSVGLLRSLAVQPENRGLGLGELLCNQALQMARQMGINSIYLLTTTAESFFLRSGFIKCDRKAAPAEIQASTEFASLCPESSVCLVKPI